VEEPLYKVHSDSRSVLQIHSSPHGKGVCGSLWTLRALLSMFSIGKFTRKWWTPKSIKWCNIIQEAPECTEGGGTKGTEGCLLIHQVSNSHSTLKSGVRFSSGRWLT